MYAEEIVAFYDPKARKIFLVKEAVEKPPSPEDLKLKEAGGLTTRQVTIAHEMVHALQHQNDPLFDLLEDERPELDDVRSALHALAEGEATVHMTALVRPLRGDWIASGIEREAASKFTSEPPVLRRLLLFPYIAGARYAGARAPNLGVLPASARLRAVPLLSTEHLIHPERAPGKDPPQAVFLPDLSEAVGGGRALTHEAVLGEAFLAPALALYEGTDLSNGFVDCPLSWGGDRLHLYEKPGLPPVAVLMTSWDGPQAAITAYARALTKKWSAAWCGTRVAIVAGLEEERGTRTAREALGRAAIRPFASVDDLRRLSAAPGLPARAAPVPDLVAALDALVADPSLPHPFTLQGWEAFEIQPRLRYLFFARHNALKKGQTWVTSERTVWWLPWTLQEIDVLARGHFIPVPASEQFPMFVEAYEKHGADWPEKAVQFVFRELSRKPSAEFMAFVGRHRNRPFAPLAAAPWLALHQKEPASRAVILEMAEAGLIKPGDARPLGADLPAFKATLCRAFLAAAALGRCAWGSPDTASFEQGYADAPSAELPQEVFDRWPGLPLTRHGRGSVLARALLHPQGGARALGALRKEIADPDPATWQYLCYGLQGNPKGVRSLPHFKAMMDLLGPFADGPKAPSELKSLADLLRRQE